jgi:peptidoglycan/LPS O-acetylase OafA/YrhL
MLRCLAAILVVLFHTETISAVRSGHVPFRSIFNGGSHGVDLFFVLSGFIISYVHKGDLGHPQRLTNYLFNRVTRIYPAVWIMSSFALALYLGGYGGAAKAAKLTGYDVTASLLLLPQLSDALINVTWTLKYEVFFYLIFATLIVNFRLGVALLLLWQLSALVLSSFFSIYELGVGGFYFTSLCLEFAIGLACTWVVGLTASHKWLLTPALLWSLLPAGAILFVFGMVTRSAERGPSMASGAGLVEAHTWSINVLCALGSALLIVSLVLLERAGRIGIPRILVFLGDASYSIYIVHFSVITLLVGALVRHRTPLNDVVCFGVACAAVGAGCAFHILIDKPIQAVLRAKVRPAVVRLTAA